MTDSISSAKAVTAFSLMTGISASIAAMIISSKYSNKQVDSGTLIMASTVAFLVTLTAVGLLREA